MTVQNSAPFYQITGPADLWVANADSAEPRVDEDPTGATWRVLGNNSLTDSGVEVTRGEEVFKFRPYGKLGVTKVFRISESWMGRMEIADMTSETYAEIMGAPMTVIPASSGVPASKSVPLMRGRNVVNKALLIKMLVAPYGPGDYSSQIWVPRAYVGPIEEPNIVENDVMFFGVTFEALEHPTNGFGLWRNQDGIAAA